MTNNLEWRNATSWDDLYEEPARVLHPKSTEKVEWRYGRLEFGHPGIYFVDGGFRVEIDYLKQVEVQREVKTKP